MEEAFAARFGRGPRGVARAPGRVNLIGEHIDYHDLSVLPMALDRAVEVEFTPRADARVQVVNARDAYSPLTLDLDGALRPGPAGHWGNYVLAAASVARDLGAHAGADLRVSSDLPAAAGLSSSSALVVALALALLAVADRDVPPLKLAEALARGERFVGTQGGGMDQAASLGARAGHALRVDFNPLRWTPVPMPRSWRVVVAHSGVTAEKSGGAQEAYNQRRADGLEALRTIASAVGRPDASYRALLQDPGVEALLAAAHRHLPPRLLSRFRHVVTEARRVEDAVTCLEAGDASGFGRLLLASHASLRDDLEVSHPRLDALVQAARDAGAQGARLTGAGFGGCMIALVGADEDDAVQDALRRILAGWGAPTDADAVFMATPCDGARVHRVGPAA